MEAFENKQQRDFTSLLSSPLRDRIVSENETATYLGVSSRTLGRWRADGVGPAWIALGEKRIGYRQSDLTCYVETNRVEPAAELRHG
ncbi:AlpA family transcriptional regulator [Methylobacterium sp. R2-1]|uniref:helix-turn-helix transcriptional regulator n=1 Tax=Methylobacterium sp. R2-1 TaxID=2587064 RepID=UPI001616B402|nr:hypothetical protein [Methylobacterium sp. R2-1]MBB2961823.1 putative DNA-binding transcriptional regulator AlpA [Methylobacterium sp. R2-1]